MRWGLLRGNFGFGVVADTAGRSLAREGLERPAAGRSLAALPFFAGTGGKAAKKEAGLLQTAGCGYFLDGQYQILADILVSLIVADVHCGVRFARNNAMQPRLHL